MLRAIRFLRMWQGKTGLNEKRDAEMTMGQRELLVTRGIAEWVDAPVAEPRANEARAAPLKKTRQQRESAVDSQ